MMTRNDDIFAIARKRMVQEQLIRRGISDQKVLSIMGSVKRHQFVEEALVSQAYIDAPLSIGEGQTISQPYIVALMTQTLQLKGTEKVLEIGTGCGYQTVILSMMAKKVYTIERYRSLAMKARERFKSFGLSNIVMRVGDGSIGWVEAAPFDCITTSCAAPELPRILVKQLKIGGVLVMPCAKSGGVQHLLRITRRDEGFDTEDLGECLFVKMVGKKGYRK